MAARFTALPLYAARRIGAMGGPSSSPDEVGWFIVACRHLSIVPSTIQVQEYL